MSHDEIAMSNHLCSNVICGMFVYHMKWLPTCLSSPFRQVAESVSCFDYHIECSYGFSMIIMVWVCYCHGV